MLNSALTTFTAIAARTMAWFFKAHGIKKHAMNRGGTTKRRRTRRMSLRECALVLGLLASGPVVRADGVAPIFGPKQYVRTTGKPDPFTDTFQNCENAAHYELIVQNGNPDGTGRVSSAVVVLNGVVVLGHNDFDQQVSRITRPVTVGKNNQLTVQLASKPGDGITVSLQCVSSCLAVRINSPTSGSAVNQSRILVAGTISSSADEVGIAVNGIATLVQGQQFAAAGLPIVVGANVLTATATNACGNQATSTELVTAGALTPPAVTFRVVPSSGVTPLTVTITADVASWNFTGNGTVDASGPSLSTATTTYTQPGLFLAQFTATDNKGAHFTGQVPILVLSPTAITTLLQGRWTGFTTALSSQNIQGALEFIDPGFADQFKNVFSTLAKQLPQIGSALGNITLVSASGGIAEFVTARTQQSTAFVYFVYFMQDTNGVWKIVAM
jgi:hypothetical protein